MPPESLDIVLLPPAKDSAISQIASTFNSWFESVPAICLDSYSDDELHKDDSEAEEEEYVPSEFSFRSSNVSLIIIDLDLIRAQRLKTAFKDEDNEWFPWPDKTVSIAILNLSYYFHTLKSQIRILDIVRHLPHSVMSNKQFEYVLWGMQLLQVPQVPSDNIIKSTSICIQQACGVRSI